jgi:hypothetical protein
MNSNLLVTFEILVVIVGPLLLLYSKGKWPVRTTIPSLLVIPVLWYLTYAPLHELSHVAGTYLVGGKVIYMKLVPSFWRGEFGQAWITPEGLSSAWQQLIMTAFPYLLDAACIAAGYFLLRRRAFQTPFAVGLLLMLLSLRPTFDLVCETLALAQGHKGDLFHIAQTTGSPVVWSLMVISIGLASYSIAGILNHFTNASGIGPVAT